MSNWQPYLISVAIGLLVGIERERAHPQQGTLGVRTFLLVAMLGAVAGGLMHPWLSLLVTAFALGLILVSYILQAVSKGPNPDYGLTTEFAAGIVFSLGYVAHGSPSLAAVMGPLVAFILFSKNSMHRFTHSINPREFEAALLLVLAGVIVINLVPDTIIDPWGIFNPRKFGYLVLTLAALEFSSYVLTKIIGERKGALVFGFFGGLVSSTAVLLSTSRQAKKVPESWRTLLCSTLAAKLAALLELLLIVGLVSRELFVRLAPAVGGGIIIGAIALIIAAWKKEKYIPSLTMKSPLDWKGILRLAVLLGAILASISVAQIWLGDRATFAVSFLTGLFELHGVSLANATMYSHGHLSIEAASLSILFATIASLFAKISICWMISRGVFARAMTAVFVPMICAIALTAWLTLE